MIEVIKYLMIENNLTIKDVADLTGKKIAYISNFLNGRVPNPTLDTLESFAKVLNVSVRDLFPVESEINFSAIIKFQSDIKKFTNIPELEKYLESIK